MDDLQSIWRGTDGGDVSSSPDRLVIDSIVGGEVLKDSAIFRQGAKAGDGSLLRARSAEQRRLETA